MTDISSGTSSSFSAVIFIDFFLIFAVITVPHYCEGRERNLAERKDRKVTEHVGRESPHMELGEFRI